MFCAQHIHKPDRAVADYYDSQALPHARRIGGILAGPQNIRRRQQTCDHIIWWQFGRRDRTVHRRRLRTGHEFALHTGRLRAKPATWTGIIGEAEGFNNELAPSDIGNGAAGFFHGPLTHRLAGCCQTGVIVSLVGDQAGNRRMTGTAA